MPAPGAAEKSDHRVVALRRTSDLIYVGNAVDLTADDDYNASGINRWTALTNFMVMAAFAEGVYDATNNLLIEVSFNGGVNYQTVYDAGGGQNWLNTILPVTNSTLSLRLKITFTGSATLDFAQEELEVMDGRLVEVPYQFATTPGGSQILAFSNRIPVPESARGIPGRTLDFWDKDLQIKVAHAITKDKGFWRVRLPYGNYEVKSGRMVLIENLVVGTASQIMNRRMTRVVNQEERANIFSTFGDLPWARFCIFDTFEDTSKASNLSSSDLSTNVRFSRFWGDNERWLEQVALFVQAV